MTCWVPAAAKLTPPVSPVTGGGRHHVSPEASLQDGWAPFLGPESRSPLGSGAAGAQGLFLCSLDGGRAGGRAGGQQRAEASQPGSQFRSGGGATASGPAPRGPVVALGGRARGWFLRGGGGGGWQLQFLRPSQGGWASGWRSFSSQYGEGGGSTDEGSAGLWLGRRRQSQVRGALGLGVARPACGSPWRCRPCQESWWGRRALLLLLVAGRV